MGAAPSDISSTALSTVRTAKSEGLAVVAIIGAGVPIELVMASGAVPVRIVARPLDATPLADALIGAGESRAMRDLIEPVLAGRWNEVDLLVITRQHEWLYYYLKEAVRLGEANLPPLHLHDLVASAEPALRTYNLQRLQRLAAVLARVSKTPFDRDELDRAVDLANRRREALRTIQERRDAGTLSGADAGYLIASSHVARIERFAEEVAERLEHCAVPSGPRILLLANDQDEEATLRQAVEAGGVVVVAEDSEWGSRSARPDLVLGDSPYEALLDDLMAASSGTDVSPRQARLAWAESALARKDIAGVIFAVPAHDSKFGWDYPSLRDRANALGLPALLLREDHRAAPDAVSAAVSTFALGLHAGIAA